MPHCLCKHSLLFALLMGCLTFVAAPRAEAADWPFFGSASNEQVGSKDWWKKKQKSAEFVPGKGYRVPGVEGFFDSKGRPMDAPVDEVVTSLSGPKKEVGLLPGLDPKKHIQSVKEAVSGGPDQQLGRAALDEGKSLFAEKKYSKAAQSFKSAIDRWPGSTIEAEAMFLLGECYFWQDKYIDARDAFDNLVSKHPNTRQMNTLVQRQWLIAQYWERYHFDYRENSRLQPNFLDGTRPTFDTIGQSIKTYDSIRLNDPTGPWADDAIMATAGIYFRQNRFGDADYHYTLLRKDYPRSEHQFNAHVLGLQAKLRRYQGADYDGTALEEAKALLKQIRTQFAGRLTDEEKKRLREAQAEVARANEERDLRLATYYDKTEHYGAARQIYARIARKYGASPIGQQARERLAQIGGEPSHPEQPMAWLVGLFPESRERSRVSQIPELRRDAQTRLAENPQSAGQQGAGETR